MAAAPSLDTALETIHADMDALIQRLKGWSDADGTLRYRVVRIKHPGVVLPKPPRHLREMLALFDNKERNLECGKGIFRPTLESMRSKGIGKRYERVTLCMKM